jgi:hypothetical protein
LVEERFTFDRKLKYTMLALLDRLGNPLDTIRRIKALRSGPVN